MLVEYCAECPFYGKNCAGCDAVKGKTFWAEEHYPDKICPIYNCSVNKKKNKTCAECKKLPCKKFTELKDPSMSDERHAEELKIRIKRLKDN